MIADQILIADQIGNPGDRRQMRAIRHQHKSFNAFHRCGEFLDDGQKGQIKKQKLIFGMVGDVFNLLREQTRIDGVQDGTRT